MAFSIPCSWLVTRALFSLIACFCSCLYFVLYFINILNKKHVLDFKLSPCSECCMLSSGWFSGVSLTYIPVASMWVIALHSLFRYSDPPPPIILLSVGSGYFRAKTFTVYLPHQSKSQLFFIPTCLWRWKTECSETLAYLSKIFINSDTEEWPRRKHKTAYCQEWIYIPVPEVVDYSIYFDKPQIFYCFKICLCLVYVSVAENSQYRTFLLYVKCNVHLIVC
jgi:hypothetical protein